jgi:hypothetical protein
MQLHPHIPEAFSSWPQPDPDIQAGALAYTH